MKLNSTQVAEKLGVTKGTLHRFMKRGMLTDLGTRKEGAKRHTLKFDSKQVNELAKTYKNRRRVWTENGNGTAPVVQAAAPTTTPATGILSLIMEMNEKLDRLLKVWG